MKIITWNINSLRLRLNSLERLILEADPDVICLQETKVRDELFPSQAIADMGYPHQAYRGMKSYNGVAIISRVPIGDAGGRDWCGLEDCRHVSARLPGNIELHNFYVPAGGDEPDRKTNPKFDHKLKFLKQVTAWSRRHQDAKAKRILVGDLNIAPLETDVWSHKQLRNVVSHTEVEIKALSAMQKAGPWVDAVRHFVPEDQKLFSWWSYRSPDWTANDRGRRLDHIWVTEALRSKLQGVNVMRDCRAWPKPSDHAPIVLTLK